MLMADFYMTRHSQGLAVLPPGACSLTACPKYFQERIDRVRFYLLIPYLVGNLTPSRGRPPQEYIMKVPWLIEGIPITSTKNLSILFCFYLFCPNSLFQTPILFSLHPGGGMRCSRWPCRPRTTLKRASPDGVPTGGVIQSNRREIVQHIGADGQTTKCCG
jgi:hypothetical protein